MVGRVLFNGLDTGVSLDNYSQCFEYIKTILPFDGISVEKVTKNDKISSKVTKLRDALTERHSVVVISYGDHVQKMASVVEIAKNGVDNVDQYNKLLSFEWIRPGKNELLEQKVRVPILVAFLCTKETQVPDIVKTNGFFKQ